MHVQLLHAFFIGNLRESHERRTLAALGQSMLCTINTKSVPFLFITFGNGKSDDKNRYRYIVSVLHSQQESGSS